MKTEKSKVKLEHVNMKVKNIDEAVRFIKVAFPGFQIRHDEGVGEDRWIHIGTGEYYIAITETTEEKVPQDRPYSGYPGIQHLGWEVGDVEGIRDRLLEAGFEESTYPNNHPHRKRVYFYDGDGNDWEFVEYFSNDPSERNDYNLPG